MCEKVKLLFLCTGNSCRSQMAEGFCRHLHRELFESHSAGIEAHGVNPNAVRVMQEVGVDISKHTSKTASGLPTIQFDYVVTVCGHANENCPVFPGDAKVIHKGFDDPPKLAAAFKGDAERLNCYRRVRDEIRTYIETFPQVLQDGLSA